MFPAARLALRVAVSACLQIIMVDGLDAGLDAGVGVGVDGT